MDSYMDSEGILTWNHTMIRAWAQNGFIGWLIHGLVQGIAHEFLHRFLHCDGVRKKPGDNFTPKENDILSCP